MDAETILDALRRRYRAPEWAFFPELRTGTGYDYGYLFGRKTEKGSVQKRLDAWALRLYPMGGVQPTGFEVKVSRGDFRRDLSNSGKLGRYLELCQFFYYVAPAGLLSVEEIPEEAGLLVLQAGGRLRRVKAAPNRGVPTAEWAFFSAICRRVGNAGTGRCPCGGCPWSGWHPHTVGGTTSPVA